jgi:excisionase family DNA binding protein
MATTKIMSEKPKKAGRPKKETTEPIKSDYLNVTELSEYLKMSTSHIYSLTSRKEIPHIKVLGKKLLFEKSEILNWLKSKKVSAK